jgi:uncharacterized membrane protein YcjF (UPF0283 family)
VEWVITGALALLILIIWGLVWAIRDYRRLVRIRDELREQRDAPE